MIEAGEPATGALAAQTACLRAMAVQQGSRTRNNMVQSFDSPAEGVGQTVALGVVEVLMVQRSSSPFYQPDLFTEAGEVGDEALREGVHQAYLSGKGMQDVSLTNLQRWYAAAYSAAGALIASRDRQDEPTKVAAAASIAANAFA